MPDPVMATMAATLVSWATTAVAERARAATSALVTFVRDRFARHPAHRQVLEAALDPAGGRQAVERLADLLAREAHRDPAFARQLRLLWERGEAATRDADHLNQIRGDVAGSVVQARDVQGGISFGTTHPPPPAG